MPATPTASATVTAPAAFAAPDVLPADLLALAEAIWATPQPRSLPHLDDSDDLLAALLGLGPGDGHDELTRCDIPGCGAWFWADEGADLVYDTGAQLRVCEAGAVPDDPGARLYPGAGLEGRWRDDEAAATSRRDRTTGRAR